MQLTLTETKGESLILSIFVAGISFLDFNQKINLIKNLDSPHFLALQSIEEIFKFAQCDVKPRAVWNGSEGLRMAKVAAYQCERLGIKVILHDDIRYPESLRQIADPPFGKIKRTEQHSHHFLPKLSYLQHFLYLRFLKTCH